MFSKSRIVGHSAILSLAMFGFACQTPTEAQPQSDQAKVAQPAKAAQAGANDSNFTLTVKPESSKVNTASSAVIEVLPQTGYKMNLDFPARLKITEPGVIQVDKAELSQEDAQLTEEGLRFTVHYTAPTAGEAHISGLADFSVCNDNACKLVRGEEVQWKVVTAE